MYVRVWWLTVTGTFFVASRAWIWKGCRWTNPRHYDVGATLAWNTDAQRDRPQSFGQGAFKIFSLFQDTYNAAMCIKNAIPHPRTMGIIREYGGKMHMAERTFEKVYLLMQITGKLPKLISSRLFVITMKLEALSVSMCSNTWYWHTCC